MAADPSTVSAIGGILKSRYLGPIREQFSRKRILEELLMHNREDIDGDKAIIPIRVAGHQSIGFRADNASLPDAGRQNVQKVSVQMAYLYARVMFTGPAIAASKSNAGAFARIMDDEMKNLVEDLRSYSNYFNYADGSGALAQITAINSTTFTVDRWCPLFTVGRKLDSYTAKSAGTQGLDSKTISSVDRANRTITMNAVTSAAVGDFLYIEDTYSVCQMGLMGIADDGTFLTTHQGMSRTSYPIWEGKVLGNGGTARNTSEGILMDGVALLNEDGVDPDLMVGTIFQRNDLIKELQKQRQFVNPEKKLKGGIRAIDICDIPFTWDKDCPPGYCFIGDTQYLTFYEMASLDWMKKDGGILSRVADKDAYEATLFIYRELGSSRNNAWARIEDLNENRPSGY